MVISFSNDTAFDFLNSNGHVVSFRTDERKKTPRTTAQETWCNRGRHEPKEFNVTVRHLAEMPAEVDLFGEFYTMSGFASPGEWKEVVVEMHGETQPTGHFYLVTRGWH